MNKKNVLTQTTRRWENNYELEPRLPINIYKTDLTLSIGEGNKIVKSTYFIYFAYTSYLKYGLIVVFLIVLLKLRTRLKKALNALLTSK